MKKIHISIVICILVLVFAVSFASAKDSIAEVPDLKIVIDGKVSVQKDVAISVNQRTLLPIRELAAKLGVRDDDEHIIWNNKEKSVTLIKDSTKIYLKLGEKTAYINDAPVELDVAPVGYTNSRVYIPFRFVAEALGQKVIWDGSTKSILISDEKEFVKVKEIIEKSNKAMESIEKFSIDADSNIEVVQNNIKIPMEMGMKVKTDKAAKKMYMLINTKAMQQDISFESYIDSNTTYIQTPFTDKWLKQDLGELGFDNVFEEASTAYALDIDNILISGLSITKDDGEGNIILEGDIYLSSLLNMANQNAANVPSDYKVSSCHLKISIDRNTYNVIYMDMQVRGQIVAEEGNGKMDMDIMIKYDYNTDFKVQVPEEVVKNAIESTDGLMGE